MSVAIVILLLSAKCQALDVNTISEGGTSLAEATKLQRELQEGDNYKCSCSFTDGEDNNAGALEAAQSAAKDACRILHGGHWHCGGRVDSIKDQNGTVGYLRDEQGMWGNPIS